MLWVGVFVGVKVQFGFGMGMQWVVGGEFQSYLMSSVMG